MTQEILVTLHKYYKVLTQNSAEAWQAFEQKSFYFAVFLPLGCQCGELSASQWVGMKSFRTTKPAALIPSQSSYKFRQHAKCQTNYGDRSAATTTGRRRHMHQKAAQITCYWNTWRDSWFG